MTEKEALEKVVQSLGKIIKPPAEEKGKSESTKRA